MIFLNNFIQKITKTIKSDITSFKKLANRLYEKQNKNKIRQVKVSRKNFKKKNKKDKMSI